MKNFKKVLALVLAVVMLLSFATVASAVTSDYYEDADDIDYAEAVDVLGSIGVLNGFPDDTFRPDATITRAQAAKIIAMFDNGDSAINGLYASANPFSDCVGHWAESYIAYGAKTGIIAGVGGDKFAPEANVTGVQFLKMALVVLGYDAKAEGLEGKNWDVNTLALARRVGLTASLGVKFDYSADLKRQEAAVIMLDALRADTVVYGNALGVNVSKLVSEISKFEGIDDFTMEEFAGVSVNGVIYLTVAGAVKTGEKLMEDWGLAEAYGTDAFYRPYRVWALNDKAIAFYLFPTYAEYTTRITGCDLLVDLGVAKTNTTKELTAARYLNGQHKADVKVHHSKVTATDDCEALNTELGGQGVLTQVFYLTKAQAEAMGLEKGYHITEIATWLGQVQTASKTTVNRDGHKVDGTEAEIDVFTGTDVHTSFTCLNFGHQWFTTTDIKLAEDDYVLVTYSYRDDDAFDAGIVDVEVVKPVTGKLTGYKTDSYPSQTAVDGTYIPDSWHFHLGYDASKTKTNVGGSYDFFYDAYGNVIGMKAVDPSATQYLVIDKMALTQENLDAVVRANVVGLDAKTTEGVSVAEIKVDDDDGYDVITVADLARAFWNGVFFWSGLNGVDDDVIANNLATWKLDAYGNYVIDLTAGNGRYLNANVYLNPYEGYVFNDIEDIKTDSSTQYLIHENDGSYTAVTGFKNMDELTAANVEFIDNDDDGVAEIVYLWGAVARVGDYVTGYVSKVPTWVDGKYYKLTVYVGDAATEICIDDDSYDDLTDGGFAPGFYTFCYTDIGTTSYAYLDADEATGSLNPYGSVKYFTALHDDTIEFDGLNYAIADDIAIYSIRTDGTVHAEDASYLESIKVGAKCYVFNYYGVYELYVVETIDAPKF